MSRCRICGIFFPAKPTSTHTYGKKAWIYVSGTTRKKVQNRQCHQTTNATPLILALAQLLSPAYVLPNQSSLIPVATETSTTRASLARRGGRLLNVLVGNYVQGKSDATLLGLLGARDMVVVPLPCQPNASTGPLLPVLWTSPPRKHSPQIPSPPMLTCHCRTPPWHQMTPIPLSCQTCRRRTPRIPCPCHCRVCLVGAPIKK